MPASIISDTSCLNLLEKIEALELLHQLYGQVLTTEKVALELGAPLPGWIRIQNPTDFKSLRILEASLDHGEASAIALALEQEDCLLIIDELKGRKMAQQLGLAITSTLGVIAAAKLRRQLSSVKPLLEKIKETNFRISEELEQAILAQVGE
ncbi:Predicted nucleic acid-binding protein, contains PIN domain [Cnuella takakiae]|uniref:Predicted nucleic acid-binding protein, contains PIN domain n=1 Tax=Cnuella takakiae TaxID=1302690 RepID=A0A1M4S8J6_9BACT|nr:DUF3368 domain-containing protein [Cnuella takakiae]OLY94419.1 DUF3368 domain-containing protein [Cnuella takakiae]SHE28520.1 Predicted nucleic acid-binding protein, contains PIN domain [Cnuella takakiae]